MTDGAAPADGLARDYSGAGVAWAQGPERVYGRLAVELVARCPGGVDGRLGLDLGAGTGAASKAMVAAGARAVVALDVAAGMLHYDAAHSPPSVVGDARRLPFADRSFGVIVAAFSLNHVSDPAAALVEAARTLVPGGGLAASAYVDDDDHPVKQAVEAACRDRGWVPPPWYEHMRRDAAPRLATLSAARGVAAEAGLLGAVAERVEVPFPDLSVADLVAWRLGMAQVSELVASLPPDGLAELAADAAARVDPCPELVRRFVMIVWRRPA